MIRGAVLLALCLTGPGFAQTSDVDAPLLIDIEDGAAVEDPAFSAMISEQLSQTEGLFVDVTDPARQDRTEGGEATLSPLNQMIADGASGIDQRDRCAALASSLYTVTAREEMRGTAQTRFRSQFSHHLRAAIALREDAGLATDVAQDTARNAVIPLAQRYLDAWQQSRRQTGSYFNTALRRDDQAICDALRDGTPPPQPRPTINQQLEDGAVGTFGQDN